MNGIQNFVGGGGAFGDRSVTRQRSSLARNTTPSNNNRGGGDSNKNSGYVPPKKDDEDNKNFIEKFFDKGKADNVITGDDFASDLKKASKYLYTQHPYAKELMAKYNLDSGDIVNLRIGMTQPGFHGKISEVFEKPGGPRDMMTAMQSQMMPGYIDPMDPDFVQRQYFEDGMKMSDPYNPFEKGSFKGYMTDKVQNIPFLSGINSLFGSPRGQRGYYYAQNELGLGGDEAKNYAAAVANNPELYNNMMATPIMQDYDFNEFVTGTQRDLRESSNRGIGAIADAEPTYDFIGNNPYFN